MGIVVALAAAVSSLVAIPEPGVASATPQVGCLKALAALAPGAVPDSSSFEPVACPDGTIAPAFRYDRARGFPRLARAVAEAEIVPVYPHFGADMVRPGQTLQLVIASGAVRIERQVEAMQAARPGQRLFVRSSDGQILSVRYGSGTQ